MNAKLQLGNTGLLFVCLIVCVAFAGGYWFAKSTTPAVDPAMFGAASSDSAQTTPFSKPDLFKPGQALDFTWPPRLNEPFQAPVR